MRILIVDADKRDAHSLHAEMVGQRFVPDTTHSIDEAIDYVRTYQYDIALVALGNPALDGVQLTRDIRAARLDVPILALGGGARPATRVLALNVGADDVMAKPVGREGIDELLARIHAITRRSAGFSHSEVQLGPVRVMLDSREVFVGDEVLHVTNKEFEILQVLVKRRNHVISKDTFLTALYGGFDTPDPKIIDVFICKLRKKLKQAGCGDLIQTAWGKGYVIRSNIPARSNKPAEDRASPTETAASC